MSVIQVTISSAEEDEIKYFGNLILSNYDALVARHGSLSSLVLNQLDQAVGVTITREKSSGDSDCLIIRADMTATKVTTTVFDPSKADCIVQNPSDILFAAADIIHILKLWATYIPLLKPETIVH